MGGNGNLGGVAKRFVSSLLRAVPTSLTMFRGGTWEGGSREEKDTDFAGETGISFERGLGMEERADDAILDIILCVRHPRVRRCCRSASLHGTIGGKRWGEAMQECGVRGRDDLSCNEPWVNSRNFQISVRQNFLSSILWV